MSNELAYFELVSFLQVKQLSSVEDLGKKRIGFKNGLLLSFNNVTDFMFVFNIVQFIVASQHCRRTIYF